MKKYLLFVLLFLPSLSSFAFDRQDTLRGSNGRGRSWWDVQKYDLDFHIDTATKRISGYISIKFRVVKPPVDSMQIDLQEGMFLEPVSDFDGPRIKFPREGNVFWVLGLWHKLEVGSIDSISFRFYGKPREAVKPPWDGGFIWTKDSTGKPWIAVACQGLGASVWWPCKDYLGDEPDSGMTIHLDSLGLAFVSNGRGKAITEIPVEDPLTGKTSTLPANSTDTCLYTVKNPINTYDVTFYIGDYIHWHDTLMGEKGKLDLDFYALRYHEAQARKQFAVVKQMIHCFEYWMGPYPFYEDGYKLVEAPYLGMEHQSAVAYGNKFKMGYLGRDRSGTGVGLLFDYIIIHESGHEWFGNSITAKDICEDWIQEGITTYSESLFAESLAGREKGFDYVRGEWQNIANDVPIIGHAGVNEEGSGDRYDKGAGIMLMIRLMINNDSSFRELMRGMSREFYHQTITSKMLEDYVSKFTGKDLQPFFDEYLRTTNIPQLEWFVKNKALHYRWTNATPGFFAPFNVKSKGEKMLIIDNADIVPVKSKKAMVEKTGLYKVKNVPF